MVNYSILRFVCFKTLPSLRGFSRAINSGIRGFFLKKLNILYIYETLILRAGLIICIPIPLINYFLTLKNL